MLKSAPWCSNEGCRFEFTMFNVFYVCTVLIQIKTKNIKQKQNKTYKAKIKKQGKKLNKIKQNKKVKKQKLSKKVKQNKAT